MHEWMNVLSQKNDFYAPWEPSAFARYRYTWANEMTNASFVKNCRGPISPKKQTNGVWLMTYYNTEPLASFASQNLKLSDRANMWLTAGLESL